MSSTEKVDGPVVIVGPAWRPSARRGTAPVRVRRRTGHVGDEAHLPYDRTPLSKEVVRGENDDTTLRPREFYDEHRIVLRLGSAATGLDRAARRLLLADGSEVEYGELIVATG